MCPTLYNTCINSPSKQSVALFSQNQLVSKGKVKPRATGCQEQKFGTTLSVKTLGFCEAIADHSRVKWTYLKAWNSLRYSIKLRQSFAHLEDAVDTF